MNSFNRGAPPVRLRVSLPVPVSSVAAGAGSSPRGIRLKQAAGGVLLPAAGR